MGLSVGGLASGLDTEGIISQLLGLENRSIQLIQRKIANATVKQQAYGDLDGRLNSLRNTVKAFNEEGLFRKTTASSSNEAVLSVSATASATPGNHQLEVLQIATRHQLAAQGHADEAVTPVAVANGAFSFRIGSGAVSTVNVNNTTTLRQLADAINALGVDARAEIVNDGSPTSPQRLVLSGQKEGLSGGLTITQNDTTLNFATPTIEAATADATNNAAYLGALTSGGVYTGSGSTTNVVEVMQTGDPAVGGGGAPLVRYSLDGGVTWDDNNGAGYAVQANVPLALSNGIEATFTGGSNLTAGDRFRIDVSDPVISTAHDAVLRINGINVTKSSNTITDLYPGVTLNLKSSLPGTKVSVNIARATGDVAAKLTSFVGAYNGVIGFLNAQFAYNPTEDTEGAGAPALNGDSAARQVQQRLKGFVTGRIPGLTGREKSALAEVGIESDQKTGLLTLNAGKLGQVLASDPTAVERLLTRFGEAVAGAKFAFTRRSERTQPGEYDVVVSQARTRAEVNGSGAADALAQDETLTIRFYADAQNPGNAGTEIQVALTAGDSAATQVSKVNAAFGVNNLRAEAFLDAAGALHLRARDHGAKFRVVASSDVAAGAGTTRIGAAGLDDTGTDLVGRIGSQAALVLDGTRLKGTSGSGAEDVEVTVPDDTFGALGRVRIVDGLGESLPGILDSLMSGTGLLKSRSDGIQRTIDDLDKQILRNSTRLEKVEQRLRRQFSNLEVTLGQLQALGDYVSAQLGGTSASAKK